MPEYRIRHDGILDFNDPNTEKEWRRAGFRTRGYIGELTLEYDIDGQQGRVEAAEIKRLSADEAHYAFYIPAVRGVGIRYALVMPDAPSQEPTAEETGWVFERIRRLY